MPAVELHTLDEAARAASKRSSRSHDGDRMRAHVAQGVCVVALAGMAYCHLKDVGMKFDEHVYYMAGLFCANIAASLLLIPAILTRGAGNTMDARAIWAAAAILGAMTIAGFLWSRTIGFPQMQDHVGEWDALGLASVAFECVILCVSVPRAGFR